MAESKKQVQTKRQYRKPVVRKDRKLTEVTESDEVLITGHTPI